jgi:hypothetical protein
MTQTVLNTPYLGGVMTGLKLCENHISDHPGTVSGHDKRAG